MDDETIPERISRFNKLLRQCSEKKDYLEIRRAFAEIGVNSWLAANDRGFGDQFRVVFDNPVTSLEQRSNAERGIGMQRETIRGRAEKKFPETRLLEEKGVDGSVTFVDYTQVALHFPARFYQEMVRHGITNVGDLTKSAYAEFEKQFLYGKQLCDLHCSEGFGIPVERLSDSLFRWDCLVRDTLSVFESEKAANFPTDNEYKRRLEYLKQTYGFNVPERLPGLDRASLIRVYNKVVRYVTHLGKEHCPEVVNEATLEARAIRTSVTHL